MAPHNTSYFELLNHLRGADILFQSAQTPSALKALLQERLHYFSRPTVMAGSGQCF